MINVVHPAYHAFPNGGHGSFSEDANLRFSCVRVFATVVVAISKAPLRHSIFTPPLQTTPSHFPKGQPALQDPR